MPTIEVINYEKANKNKVIGYVDIEIPKWGMVIRRIAHLQSGDKKWFNLPCFPRSQADGTQKYFRYWELKLEAHNGDLMAQLSDKVKEYCEKNKIDQQESVSFEEELPF